MKKKEELTESGSQLPIVEPAVLGWDTEGEAKLRGIWGKGSHSIEERKQQGEIEEIITISSTYDRSHNIVLSYPKFHCELNHIEHFWCHSKGYARHFYENSLEKLRIRVPEALASVANSPILGNYNRCREKNGTVPGRNRVWISGMEE